MWKHSVEIYSFCFYAHTHLENGTRIGNSSIFGNDDWRGYRVH